MSDDQIIRRDIVLVTLPANAPRGREQEGTRPAVVTAISNGRYPLVLVVPLTTQMGDWIDRNPILYPQLEKGSGGLSKPSVALLDQLRGLDVTRVIRYLGTLTPEQYYPLLKGLKQLLEV